MSWLGKPVTYRINPKALRETRKKLGIKQTELAREIGVYFTFICNLEKGRRTTVSAAMANKIRRAFETKPPRGE